MGPTVVKLTASKMFRRAAGFTLRMESNLSVRENSLSLDIVVSTTKAIVHKKLSLEFNAVNSPKNLSDLNFQNKLINRPLMANSTRENSKDKNNARWGAVQNLNHIVAQELSNDEFLSY